MAISLRTSEEVKVTADFHWSSYIGAGALSGFMSLVALGQLVGMIKNRPEADGKTLFIVLAVGCGPILYKLLANKCKQYVVTNQRLYVEEGILAKKKKDIPLQKVNDLEVSQGIIQRIFGAGNILVLTGNDKPTQLSNIDKPETFKNQISEILGKHSEKATS